MPWIQTDPVNERKKFGVVVRRGNLTMVEACRQFGISRNTGYKSQHRQQTLGPEGLRDLPRAPCDPMTIDGSFSRAWLICSALLAPKTDDAKKQFEGSFHRFGLPSDILSETGTPLAFAGIGGLSRLSVWMLRLGV